MSAFAYPSSGLVHGLSRLLFPPLTQRTRYEGRNLLALTPVAPQRADHTNNQVNLGKSKPPTGIAIELMISVAYS